MTIVAVVSADDLHHLRALRKDLHDRWVTDENLLSFHVSAKSGDGIRKMFFQIAATLAGVSLPKSAKDTVGNVVKAQIVNHALVDAENLKHHSREQEKIHKILKKQGNSKKKKNACIIS